MNDDDGGQWPYAHPLRPATPSQFNEPVGLCCFAGTFGSPSMVAGALVMCGSVLVAGDATEECAQSFLLADEIGVLDRHELHFGLDERSAKRGRQPPRSSFLAVFKPKEHSRGARTFSRQLHVRLPDRDATFHVALAVCQLAALVEAPEWRALRQGAPLLSDRLIASLLLAEPTDPAQDRPFLLIDHLVRTEAALVAAGHAEETDLQRLYGVSGHALHTARCAEPSDGRWPSTANRLPAGRRQPFMATLGLEPFETDAFFIELGDAHRPARLFGPVPSGAVEKVDRAVSSVLAGLASPFSVPPARAERLFRPLVAPPHRSLRTKRFDYKPASGPPTYSLIIPFFGDAFYLTSVQDLHRILDSRFEIVLVVDDPRLWAPISRFLDCRRASLRLRTVLLLNSHNAGYAAATNIGARAASGRILFLMNSDVYVREPDALLVAGEEIDRRSQAGSNELIAGFSLLYEDYSIQHVGIELKRQPAVHDLYIAEHPMKGMPSELYTASAACGVDAVTGALLGISRAFYAALGGLDEIYVRGDFEDVDLCLRARRRGAEIKVFPSRSLFHFERQAVSHLGIEPFRHMITYVNALTFNQRWASDLDARRSKRVHVRRRETTQRASVASTSGESSRADGQ